MATEKTILDRQGWEIIKTLGEGGQAKVHLVKKKGEPDVPRYALKVLRTEEGKQSYDRFHREIEALKKVDHPGGVKIVAHGGDEAEGLHFYVMEYIEGLQPLKRIVGTSENPFYQDALKSLNIYIRILEALQACEKAGVVHRDLSLGNVMVFPDYQAVKLIDFGCCFIEDGHCITLTDEAVGTPGYRAPECENPSDESITIRADLYSAGKILWSIITNRKAFFRENPVFTNQSLEAVIPEAPITWHLHGIFEKTVRHKQENRYHSAFQAIEDSERVKNRIQAGFLPLKILAENLCPICGVEHMIGADTFNSKTLVHPGQFVLGRDEQVMSSLNELGTSWSHYSVCPHCGFMGLFLGVICHRVLKHRKTLD
jgi:serine/threonine protein kinase